MNKEHPLTTALTLAWQKLQNKNPEYVAKAAGFSYQHLPLSDKNQDKSCQNEYCAVLIGKFLDNNYAVYVNERKVFTIPKQISLPSLNFLSAQDQNREEGGEFFALLILHYLTGVTQTPLANEWISFKELPSGGFYFPAFEQRCIKKILDTYGQHHRGLLKAASRTELEISPIPDIGDVAIKIMAFPKLPVCIAIWAGEPEEGLPTSATVLFDRTASQFLPTEDLSAIATLTVSKLSKTKKHANS